MVEDDQTATRQLESLLSREDRPVEVLNFGCSSYSPLLGVHLYDRLVRQFSPDAVFYFFHSTDFRDDAEYRGVHLRAIAAIPETPVYWDNPRWGRLGRLVRMRFHAWLLAEMPVGPISHDRYATFKRREELTADDWGHITFTLDQMGVLGGLCQADGIPFVLAIIPSPDQVEGQPYAIGSGFAPLRAEMAGRTTMQEIIAEGLAVRQVACVDLRSGLAEYGKAHPEEPLYLLNDGHWGLAGQRAVAQVLEGYVRTMNLSAGG